MAYDAGILNNGGQLFLKANGGLNIAQIDTYVWRIALDDILDQHHEYVGHVNIVK